MGGWEYMVFFSMSVFLYEVFGYDMGWENEERWKKGKTRLVSAFWRMEFCVWLHAFFCCWFYGLCYFYGGFYIYIYID